MNHTERTTLYFRYCGEANTRTLLHAIKLRCEDLKSKKVVIASEAGNSVLKALEIFSGTSIEVIAVTHYPAFTPGPKGKIPIGIRRKEYQETYKALVKAGVGIVQGTVAQL